MKYLKKYENFNYCFGSMREKKLMWDEISVFRMRLLNWVSCIVGNFNSIKRKEERKTSGSDYSRKNLRFNNFIEKVDLLDIPIVGKKFTWYKSNRTIISRIDRAMVSKEWLEVWSNSRQFIYSRIVFVHCVLVLKDSCSDWGPKPFRSLDG